jgi:hypothetical protein
MLAGGPDRFKQPIVDRLLRREPPAVFRSSDACPSIAEGGTKNGKAAGKNGDLLIFATRWRA